MWPPTRSIQNCRSRPVDTVGTGDKQERLPRAPGGAGSRGPPRGPARVLMEAANASRVPILAVDIPSGLNADTGQPEGPAIHAIATVTMALPQGGLLGE